MGCASSLLQRPATGRCTKGRKHAGAVPVVVIFVPVLMVPVPVDFYRPLRETVAREILDRLDELRGRVVSLIENGDLAEVASVSELQRALEEYLPFLLGLTKKEYRLETLVEFKWKSIAYNHETCLANAWYEVLSAVHMMAMLIMLEANLMIIPKDSSDSSEKKVSEDSMKVAVDLMLKASGLLDFCVHSILVNLPLQIRKDLPNCFKEGFLAAVSIQAIAQGVEMQLGMALQCEKATLSVKRRLACEAVTYILQAHYCLSGCHNNNACGKKLALFLNWKYLEAKAAAYYYHGLVLDKGNSPSSHINALCCSLAAEELLKDSKITCLSFCMAAPVTRVPPTWGVMKHLNKKIPENVSRKSQMYGHLLERDKVLQSLPDLPEFPLSLRPEDYELPEVHASWNKESCRPPRIHTLKAHLSEDEDDLSA